MKRYKRNRSSELEKRIQADRTRNIIQRGKYPFVINWLSEERKRKRKS